ncbi:hypothetical protein, partial [Rhodopirellula baltica]|uniref:hypothetical protein n=1 Tax=Rhodopirellula baltica TaxID=265606 RepID=UPI0023F1C79D
TPLLRGCRDVSKPIEFTICKCKDNCCDSQPAFNCRESLLDGPALPIGPGSQRKSRLSFGKWLDVCIENSSRSAISSLYFDELIQVYKDLFNEDRVGVLVFEELTTSLISFAKQILEFPDVDEQKTEDLVRQPPRN